MVPYPAAPADRRDARRLRREVLALVAWVVAVDALFIGGYFLAGLDRLAGGAKLAYAGMWTAATLAVVLRGLTRVRAERLRRRGERRG